MRTSRRHVSRGTRHKRKLVWARAIQPNTSVNIQLVNAPFRADLLSAFETSLGASLIGCTIMRIRGAISITGLVTGTATNENLVAAVRIGDSNDAAGSTVVNQNPAGAAQNEDWMMWEPFIARSENTTGTDLVGRLVDVRARRRLDELGQNLLLYVGGSAPSTTTVGLAFNLSILVALP